MTNPIFFPLSLLAILLCAGIAPVEPRLRALGGGLLLLLWGYGLARARGGDGSADSLVKAIPGHTALFLGLGLVGARAGLAAWFLILPLALALDLAQRSSRRFLAAFIYVILWLDVFAATHQLVALGRRLSGAALWAWSGGVGIIALPVVALGALRILRTRKAGERLDKNTESSTGPESFGGRLDKG
jgi:hypothetical protein